MHQEWKSILAGGFVAALLILPTLAHGQTSNSPAPSNWVTKPRASFEVRKLSIDSVVGQIRIDVKDSGPMTLDVSGTPRAVNGLSARIKDGTLEIEGSDAPKIAVWDWRKWFDFSEARGPQDYKLRLHLIVPRGSDVEVEDFVGSATMGDTLGNLDFSANATKSKFGKVKSAKIELNGSGQVDLAQVAGALKIEVNGSGRVNAGDVQSLRAELNGSGNAAVGAISGPLHLEIAGSGDLTATKVVGPVHIEIAGAGSVKIADGVADPFKVEIAGSGDVAFGGLAVNPQIEALGSGKVRIHAIRGKLSSEGMANVKIGD
ncbi:MAG TPA: DUF2807 domain-containing protein [Rhizomicrobium sp.]|nr:DUF2807 domain-containing protein [Rhizomicrobium sp.]